MKCRTVDGRTASHRAHPPVRAVRRGPDRPTARTFHASSGVGGSARERRTQRCRQRPDRDRAGYGHRAAVYERPVADAVSVHRRAVRGAHDIVKRLDGVEL
jgi:hypothetical protein